MSKSILDRLAAKPERSDSVYHTHGGLEDTSHFIGDTIISAGFRAVRGVVHLVTGSPDSEPVPQTQPDHPTEATTTQPPEHK